MRTTGEPDWHGRPWREEEAVVKIEITYCVR